MRGWAAVAHPFFMWSFLLLTAILPAQTYSAASIVNTATGQPVLAPNGYATVIGKDFSLETRSLTPTDIINGELPVTLPTTGVRVTIEGIAAPILYTSPTQINFLVPPNIRPRRDALVVVSVFGKSGPVVNVNLAEESPGLLERDPETPVAFAADGSAITADRPALRGEEIILHAIGLGRVDPDAEYRQVPKEAAPLVKRSEFRLFLGDTPISDNLVRFVGAAPGAAGLYHVSFTVPENCETNPRIEIEIAGRRAQSTLRLPVQ